MQLKEYIKNNNFSIKDFANKIGISSSALSNYIHKRREPKPHIRAKIIALTKGKVKVEDLLK
jgi:transcriptional regulator with XRE-family HTH domain